MAAIFLATMLSVGAEQPADTLVVCPPAFRETVQPWVDYRAAQGYRLALISSELSPEAIRAAIRQYARRGPLRAVVLVGDADPRAAVDPLLRTRSTPVHHVEAKVNVLWGSEPEIATDNWYADLDDDDLPDVPIGRLSVDTSQELSRIIAKIIDYESAANAGMWQRKINFVAGVGGFGAVVDSVIETATKKFLTDDIPPAYETSMTYGSWRSPFCPDPRNFHQATLDRLNEGSLFWVYIGHGQRRYLDRVQTPGGQFHIFDTDDVVKLQRRSGAPIAVFLACYTGSFDELRDCLGEELLRAEDGPVAALCGSRITMPYAMAVMGTELMDQYFRQRRATLGEVIMHAKRQMARTYTEEDLAANPNRRLLDSIAAVISPAPDLIEQERREHVHLFNLLGDPLLKLHHPAEVTVDLSQEAYAGSQLTVSGMTPVAGKCTVELVCRRDRLKATPRGRERFVLSDVELASYDQVYADANDRLWSTQTLVCDAGPFDATLEVPAEASGPCFVRVFVDDKRVHAVGAAPVYVRKARP